MKAPHPLAAAVQNLRDVTYRVAREWEAAEEEIDDQDEQDALHRALCEGYPLGRDLDDLVADLDVYAEHVENVLANRPSVLQLAAAEIAECGPRPALSDGIASNLRNLLLAIDAGDSDLIAQHADRLARGYRSDALSAFVDRQAKE